MNITILSKSDDEIRVEIGGEDHTLLNLLKDALLRIDEVDAAAYDMNPEQSGSKTDPILYVKTEGVDPLEAIETAAETVEEDSSEFKKAVEDSL